MELDENGRRLKAWFLSHGGYLHPHVDLALSASGYGLWTRAAGTEPPAVAVTVPLELTLSVLDIDRAGVDWPDEFLEKFADSPDILTRFLLMREALRVRDGVASFWGPYIEALPQPQALGDGSHGDLSSEEELRGLHTPLWYTPEDWQFIEGTNLGAAAKAREKQWRGEYQTGMNMLIGEDGLESNDPDLEEYERRWYVRAPSLPMCV